jgi:hypothetical protein
MKVDRSQHTATLLRDGRVLVVGGQEVTYTGNYPTLHPEIYDPATNSWTEKSDPVVGISWNHSATLLPSGKVLVLNGTTAAIFDPVTDTWSTATTPASQQFHKAVLLPSGRVLMVGGQDQGLLYNLVQRYDPAADRWTTLQTLGQGRYYHAISSMTSGGVLVTGGTPTGSDALTSSEIFLDVLDGRVQSLPRAPVVGSLTNPLPATGQLLIGGSLFTGDSEATSGDTGTSATNFPIVELRRLDNEAVYFASPLNFTATSYTSRNFTSELPRGAYGVTMFVNGLPSWTQVVSVDRSVGQVSQSIGTISFAPATLTVGGSSSVSATASSGLAVSFESLTPSKCSVTSGTVTAITAGNCVISASQAGNSNFAAALPVTQGINVTSAINGTLTTRYRLYSETTKEHLYTTDLNEYNTLPVCCSWKAEGSIYQLFLSAGSVAGVNAVPYYRLYNPYSFQHHWTTDVSEYNALGAIGWSKEGIDGYVLPAQGTGSVPLYRLYLNANGGLHLWTTDANEKNVLTTSQGWKDEGIAGYVVPLQ